MTKFDFSPLATVGMIVTFTKKNGEERVMKCTTNLESVPEEKRPTTKAVYDENQKRVWDMEKGAWRSFRIDSVVSAVSL